MGDRRGQRRSSHRLEGLEARSSHGSVRWPYPGRPADGGHEAHRAAGPDDLPLRTLRELWRASEALPVFVAAALVTVALAGLLFGVVWRQGGRARRLGIGLSISVATFALGLAGLELYFAGRPAQSDGYAVTLAGRRWFAEHWRPINSLGYRDHEPDWAGERTLLVVGDSFAAGHGVEDVDDLMSGVLARELGDGWNVAIIAKCGWGPREELEALQTLGRAPDWLVVSYYINDVECAARDHGDAPPAQLLRPPPAAVRSLVERSHAVNWFYWRVVRGRFGTTYWDWLRRAYENETVLATHLADLQGFVDLAAEVGARLDFVVWPNLDHLAASRPYTDTIVRRLRERGVHVLDLGERFEHRRPEELVVNSLDGHPNPATHAEVARLLLERRP